MGLRVYQLNITFKRTEKGSKRKEMKTSVEFTELVFQYYNRKEKNESDVISKQELSDNF